MEKGILDIVTTVDGKETKKTWDATCDFGKDFAHLHYRDEESYVNVWLKDGKVEIVRKGDYGLTMTLEEGVTHPVVLELGGNVGEINVLTYRLGYLLSSKSCMLNMHYALCFSETERQEITLRIYAKCI